MLKKVESIIREAALIMQSALPEGIDAKEGHANFVTKADRETQDFLETRLQALLPDSVVFGEEKVNEPLSDAPTWVVDPIDGTTNYIHGLGHSAISVALALNRKLVLAAVYNPYQDEFFLARHGKGAYLNGEPISCARRPLDKALTFFGTSPYKAAMAEQTFKTAYTLMRKTVDVRRMGSAVLDLAAIACGRADIFFEFSLSPWDYAAGKLLIEEAGGVFRLMNLGNEELDFSTTGAVFAANSVCAGEAYDIIFKDYQLLKEGLA
ncbi:MAG: inositol monophosphatase [Clostridiales bacterium]|jgi:myo-inositol-1(or 4)-monophosphatase|nr:inositol monophosphatase [Clostridiales bacterium]